MRAHILTPLSKQQQELDNMGRQAIAIQDIKCMISQKFEIKLEEKCQGLGACIQKMPLQIKLLHKN